MISIHVYQMFCFDGSFSTLSLKCKEECARMSAYTTRAISCKDDKLSKVMKNALSSCECKSDIVMMHPTFNEKAAFKNKKRL